MKIFLWNIGLLNTSEADFDSSESIMGGLSHILNSPFANSEKSCKILQTEKMKANNIFDTQFWSNVNVWISIVEKMFSECKFDHTKFGWYRI